MMFKVGDFVWYLRFDKKENEYQGFVLSLNMPRNTVLIECNGCDRYLAPISKLELVKSPS